MQDYRCTKVKKENTFRFDKYTEQSPASECQAIGYVKRQYELWNKKATWKAF